ncbi:MAG: DUF2066 domain-containing protein [Alphaproteobacteria bacterium]
MIDRLITTLFMMVLLALPAAAAELYTVTGVKVDARAKDAVTAQAKAMALARIKAFNKLMKRLLPEGEAERFKNIPPGDLDNLIQDYEVTHQKNSARRYIATLTFTFDENAIKDILGGQQITSAATTPRNPLVVVPILMRDGKPQLWGDINPWFNAWKERKSLSALTPVTIPIGDLTDMQSLNISQAFNRDPVGLEKLSRRYGTAGALIVIARIDSNNPTAPMEISSTIWTLDGRSMNPKNTYAQPESGKPFDQAISQAITSLESFSKQQVTVHGGHNGIHKVLAQIPFNSLQEWRMAQSALRDIPSIQQLNLNTISRQGATANLTFTGNFQTLASALSARGFRLIKLGEGLWEISSSGTPTYMPS